MRGWREDLLTAACSSSCSKGNGRGTWASRRLLCQRNEVAFIEVAFIIHQWVVSNY